MSFILLSAVYFDRVFELSGSYTASLKAYVDLYRSMLLFF